MCSYTILGLRPIENLKARKELVIRCTKTEELLQYSSRQPNGAGNRRSTSNLRKCE